MTREEQIEKVINDDWNHLEGDCPDVAFRKGVKWADSHPDWHKYEKDREFPKEVILYTTEGTFSAEYIDHLNQFFSGNEWIDESTIIAWMRMPELPKFD